MVRENSRDSMGICPACMRKDHKKCTSKFGPDKVKCLCKFYNHKEQRDNR